MNCRQKYNWRYVELIERIGPSSEALFFGTTWHDLLELYHGMRKSGDSMDNIMHEVKTNLGLWCATNEDLFVKVLAMFYGYVKAFPEDPWEVEWLEKEFKIPLTDPETGDQVECNGDLWFFAGKRDGFVRWNGRPYLLEHKTKSSYLNMGSYTRDLDWDRQIHVYSRATEIETGEAPEGIVYNIAQKLIRKRKYIKAASSHESTEAFLARYREAYEELNSDKLGNYFHREVIPYDRNVADEEMADMAEIAREISRADHRGVWLKNKSRCNDYNRPCQYLRLCKSPDPSWLIETEYQSRKAHSELSQ